MASYFKITDRYAKALIDLGNELNELDNIKKDVDLVLATCREQRDLILLFKNPIVMPQKKVKIIKLIFQDKISKVTAKFLEVIVKKNRAELIYEILEHFEEKFKTFKGLGDAYFVSATKVSDNIEAKVIAMVEKASKQKITLHTEINADLIGGFTVRYKDLLVDASVKTKLKDLEKHIVE